MLLIWTNAPNICIATAVISQNSYWAFVISELLYIVFINSISRTEHFLFLGRESKIYGWVCTLILLYLWQYFWKCKTFRETFKLCSHWPYFAPTKSYFQWELTNYCGLMQDYAAEHSCMVKFVKTLMLLLHPYWSLKAFFFWTNYSNCRGIKLA